MLQLDPQGELSCASCATVNLGRRRVRAEKGLVAKSLVGVGLVVVTTAVKFAVDLVERPPDMLPFSPFIALGATLIALGITYELYLRRLDSARAPRGLASVGQRFDRLTAKIFRQPS